MPYINKDSRQKYDVLVDELTQKLEKNGHKPGDINYCFSRLLWSVFLKNPSYTLGNSLIGVLECIKLEFYRRRLGVYEDDKLKENGDLFS